MKVNENYPLGRLFAISICLGPDGLGPAMDEKRTGGEINDPRGIHRISEVNGGVPNGSARSHGAPRALLFQDPGQSRGHSFYGLG